MSYPPPFAPEFYPQPLPPTAPPKGNGLAITGLILGIVGSVLCWVPGLGFLIGVSAIVFSAIALAKSASKAMSIIGLVLGVLTLFVNVIVIAALGSAVNEDSKTSPATSSPAVRTTTIAPTNKTTKAATTAPTVVVTIAPAPKPKPKSYPAITARQWQKLVKNPDAYIGKTYTIHGQISQFDGATGPDMFLAYTSYRRVNAWYDSDVENAIFNGDADALEDFTKNDRFVAKVTVLGAYSYDTQVGGNTTVSSFTVDKIQN